MMTSTKAMQLSVIQRYQSKVGMMVKAVSYLRVSGKGQIDGDGFDRQTDVVVGFAASNGLTIVDTFRDEGVSGTNELADRPGLAVLLDRVESNGVKVVLVEKSQRLARDLMVAEMILAQFRKIGVQVIECDGGHDLTVSGDDSPTGKLIRQILGAVDEFDKNVTVLKLRAARERKRRQGQKCEGRKAYGERPGETVIVERILKLRRKPRGADRLSFAAIADRLNTAGIPTRQGGLWRPSTIQNVVKRAGRN